MMNSKTKETILDYFLSGTMKLSHYDYRFMASLKTIISKNGKITSNQANLFDNLLVKYQKQLKKNFPDYETLAALEWEAGVVETSVEHTSAYVTFEESVVRIKVPFNKKFINYVNTFGRNEKYPLKLTWDNETKTYTSPFSTLLIKFLDKQLPAYFSGVVYCDTINKMLAEVRKFESYPCVWNPTLVKSGDRLYIAAITPVLAEAMGEIQLALDAKTFEKMSRYGITISPDLLTSIELEVAGKDDLSVNIKDIRRVIATLKELGHTKVIVSSRLSNNVNLIPELENANIKFKTAASYVREADPDYTIYFTEASKHKFHSVMKNIMLITV